MSSSSATAPKSIVGLHEQPAEVEFLRNALGAPGCTAPLQRSLPTGERFRSDRAAAKQLAKAIALVAGS